MLSKKLLLYAGALAMLLLLAAMTGCSDSDNLIQNPETAVTQNEDAGDTSPPDYAGISADSINALGRAAMLANGGKTVEVNTALGWQLYVNVPFYSQRDLHWSGKKLGFGRCGSTIGSDGCYLTSLCMVYAKLGTYVNPAQLNDWGYAGRSHYIFQNSGCGDLIRRPQAYQYPGMSRRYRTVESYEIYDQLRRGRPVIVKVYYSGDYHFMVIFAFDGSRFWVKDPWRDWRHQDRPLYGTFVRAETFGY